MKRVAAFLFFAFPAMSLAGFNGASRGTSAATFLSLGAGARGAAMGGAQTAATEGPFSLAWNPAGIATRRSVGVDVMHADWFDEASYNVVCAAAPIGESSSLGVAVQQYGVGDITRRDTAGFADGSFEPQDTSAALAWARQAGDGYAWGASAKFVRSKIADSASAVALDAGLMAPEKNGRRWGLSILNLGGDLTFDDKAEPLPLIVAVGGAQRWKKTLVAVDLKAPRDNAPYLALGAEYALAVGGGWQGLGRLGYNTRAGTDAGAATGLAVGFGLAFGWLAIDYAFAPFGDLGSVHLFSLSLRGR